MFLQFIILVILQETYFHKKITRSIPDIFILKHS